MKKASITEAKNGLSALLDRVKAGASVLIVDRGRPVARLEPVTAAARGGDDGRLERLVREGLVRPARTGVARTVLTTEPPQPTRAVDAVQVLLDERRSGR